MDSNNRDDLRRIYDALGDIHWRLKRLEQQFDLPPSPMERQTAGNAVPTHQDNPAAQPEPDLADIARSVSATQDALAGMERQRVAPVDRPIERPVEQAVVPDVASDFKPDFKPDFNPEATGQASRKATGRTSAEPSLWERLFAGNLVAKIGVIVLFFGVGFLLKYAYDNAVLSPGARLAGIAAVSVALFALARRLLASSRGYALVLMGAAAGLLYLDIYFGLKLFGLIDPALAFGCFIVLGVATMLLAVRLDAPALAVLGIGGAFLAPILASSGGGDHVVLFSYYTLLNLLILATAWFKSWRTLNLTGFLFTFFVAVAWGVLRYQPQYFASTEPFLIGFFAIYVVIPVLFALRQPPDLRGLVDGTLVFGVPLACAGLQAGLVRDLGEHALAWSTLLAGALYALLHVGIRGREALRQLAEAYLALAVALLTLTIWFAFDPYPSFAMWTLEGAAVAWIALRQKRRGALAFGVLLQVVAAYVFLDNAFDASVGNPYFNPVMAGCVLIAAAGWLTAYLVACDDERARAAGSLAPWLDPLGVLWGGVWWLVAGTHVLGHATHDGDLMAHLWLVFAGVSLLAIDAIGNRLEWLSPRRFAVLLPVLMALAFLMADMDSMPLANWGWLGWPVAFACAWRILQRQEQAAVPGWHGLWHVLLLWLACGLVAQAGWEAVERHAFASGWSVAATAVPLAVALAALSWLERHGRWPYAGHADLFLRLGVMPLLVLVCLWTLVVNFGSEGNAWPWDWRVLVNPLDLAQLALFGAAYAWRDRLTGAGGEVSESGGGGLVSLGLWNGVSGALVFLWLNAALMRSLHHLTGMPLSFEAMFDHAVASSALSLLWTVTAMLWMLRGVSAGHRGAWFAGAILLGAVVLKLFLNDLGNSGTVARIVSFIGVGLLLLLIGYIAPLPGRGSPEEEKA